VDVDGVVSSEEEAADGPKEDSGENIVAAADDEQVLEQLAAAAGRESTGPPRREFSGESPDDPQWQAHKKHFFVLSSAGKPIYSRYGDESKLSGLTGIMQAIISVVEDSDDTLRTIATDSHKFVFLLKGPIYLVCVSSLRDEAVMMQRQLEYLHSQILSILTAGIDKILTNRAQFDLRNLLGGTEKFLDSIAALFDADPSLMWDAVKFMRLPPTLRTAVNNIFLGTRTPDLLFALLIDGHELVSILRPRKHALAPSDIHLIANAVNSSSSFKSSESWSPICLPAFNKMGFLHAYVCFLSESLCLVLLSTKPDNFFQLSGCKAAIQKELVATGSLEALEQGRAASHYSVSETGVSEVMHFVYKHLPTGQFTCPIIEAPYNTEAERRRLLLLYQHVFVQTQLHTSKPHKSIFHATSHEVVFGVVAATFHLFIVIPPLMARANALRIANTLLKWIRQEETSLFSLSLPLF